MTERPILFSAPMVRAILAGRKTQTRRPVRELPGDHGGPVGDHVKFWRRGEEDSIRWCGCDGLGSLGWLLCPLGEPGDLLWVRETWAYFGGDEYLYQRDPGAVQYRSDATALDSPAGGRWRPSIHMPKWASRIWLRVTDVRVERVQDITEDDARADGVEPKCSHLEGWSAVIANREAVMPSHSEEFARTWRSIYGESWDRNDWVWRIVFERCEAPDVEEGNG